MRFDYCIVGCGIVGLATGLKILEERPGASLLLLEKESAVARHQTGRNSGVAHAGIYYAPDSLKARLCREGLRATREFCAEHDIAFDACGKLIVATDEVEEERLAALYDRATRNHVALERLGPEELSEREPAISGTAALLSKETGMVDFSAVSRKLQVLLAGLGAQFRFGTDVDHIHEFGDHVEIGAGAERWTADKLVVCAGLQSDRMAGLAGLEIDFRIIPFRGEYFRLQAEKSNLVKHHIYPAPDPKLPFLGVHLTRTIDGGIIVGPNAVLGLAREGYDRFAFNLRDAWACLGYAGFWRLVATNARHAAHELYGSVWKPGYLEECRRYCSSIELGDLLPYRTGIRAQVVSSKGVAVHDFLFKQTDRMLHVCNAPSPAATSAFPIGSMITRQLLGTG